MTVAARIQDPTTSPVDLLWARYRTHGDADARAQLLDRYLGLVHHVAREVSARTPVDFEELVSAGTLGLIRALDSFDLGRGLAFSTYAVRRIRGAILDELRSRDWTPRSARVKARRLAAVVAQLQIRLGREPRPLEVARELGIPLEAYWEWRSLSDRGPVMSFEGSASGPGPSLTLAETLDDPDAPRPEEPIEEAERAGRLRAAIAQLPDKERTVLALYYYEELNLRQIAESLHVTESRISQIRSRALARLRECLADREML